MVKITELDPPPSPLTGAEQVPIVQGGEMYIAGLGELMESVAQPFVDGAAEQFAMAQAAAEESVAAAGLLSAGHMALSKPVNGARLGVSATFGSSTGAVTPAKWSGVSWRDAYTGSFLALRRAATVAVSGDSIDRGVGASVPATNGWAFGFVADMGAAILNRSVDGSVLSSHLNRPNNLRSRFETDFLGANRREVAVIGCAFNDARWLYADLAKFQSDYDQMITRLLLADGYTYETLICKQPPYISDTGLITSTDPDFAGNSRATFELTVNAVTAAAQAWGLPLAPLYDHFKNNAGDRATLVALVDSVADKIHYPDAGHELLRQVAKTRTYVANTLPRVTNLQFVASASGSFTTRMDRCASADSYEIQYGLLSALTFAVGSSTINQATTATIDRTITGLAEGVYIARVRGIFGGVPGPWAITRVPYQVAGTLVETINGLTGSLAGPNATALETTVPTTGAWAKHPTSSANLALNGSSRIRASGVNQYNLYTLASAAIPAGGRVYSEVDVFDGGGWAAGAILHGPVARLHAANRICLAALWNGQTVRLFYLNGTTLTTLGTYTPPEPIGNYNLAIGAGVGSQLVYLNGAPVISKTFADADLPGLGTGQGIMVQTGGFSYNTTANTGLLFTRVETGLLS